MEQYCTYFFKKTIKWSDYMKRVVITGMGVISPIGTSVKTLWNNLVKGKSAISTLLIDLLIRIAMVLS